jgi:type II secretory pathway pseudopilin PulG
MKTRGFTVLETLLVLGLSLLVFMAAFEFFGLARNLFTKLKGAEENNQAAVAALDKIRTDLLQAGQGLVTALRHGVVESVLPDPQTLTISTLEKAYGLTQDLLAGQTRLPLQTVTGLSPQREVCLTEEGWSELHTLLACTQNAVVLAEPLQASFSMNLGRLLLIEKVVYYLDGPAGVLRRKVNASSPQPLLDDVASFTFSYDKATNLAKAGFTLKSSQEKKYEISIFPKNIGLSLPVL